MLRLAALLFAGLVLVPPALLAASFPLPPAGEAVIGQIQYVVAQPQDTLADIARRFDVGYEEMVRANPGVDPWLPGSGRRLVVPTYYVLPQAPRRGIVINLPEMRLYYFPSQQGKARQRLFTYPVSIGRKAWQTPRAITHVIAKQVDPVWRPPMSVRVERATAGESLPPLVPPGPGNPLGRFALRLALPGYLIHGTNKPFGIGMRVTHGCLRLYPEDIAELYAMVQPGEEVRIVHQPYKAGWQQGRLYLEAHADDGSLSEFVRAIIAAGGEAARVDWSTAQAVARERRGVPQAVTD